MNKKISKEEFNQRWINVIAKIKINNSLEEVENFANEIDVVKENCNLQNVSICVCGTEIHRELVKRADGMVYCGKCDKPY